MDEGYEVDFLSSGGADAISVRYGTPGNYKVMIYDGATRECGEALVKHVRLHYGTNHVDYAVCSHADAGRAGALSVVLENMTVGQLWMHRSWDYSEDVLRYFTDPRSGDDERLRSNLAAIFELEDLAAVKAVRMYEPFKGAQIGAFHVMSPERRWYVGSLLRDLAKPDARTSAENESDVVLVGEIGERKLLLTGNAGIRALTATADYAEGFGLSLAQTLGFIQIPRHGSRDNVSPSVLDRLIGPRIGNRRGHARLVAFISAGADTTMQSHHSVVDEFVQRGAAVVATNGRSIRHHFNMGPREGWRPVGALPFGREVDASVSG